MPEDDSEMNGPDVEEIDEILVEGTPPNYWAEDYVERRFSGRTSDCGLQLSLPSVTVATPEIADIRGLDQAQRDMDEVSNLVASLIQTLRRELPRSVDSMLEWLLGPTAPSPLGTPPRIPFIPSFPRIPNPFSLQHQVSLQAGIILEKLYEFPPRFMPTTPVTPNPFFSPKVGTIEIGTSEIEEVAVVIFSRMTSTYSFGRGQGTSIGQVSGQPFEVGIDLPWIAKALLLKSKTEEHNSHPRNMRHTSRHLIAQLGHANEQTTIHAFNVKLETISHGISIPVRFNGNYGEVRVILIPKEPCKVLWGEFKVEGSYESDVVALEEARFTQVETAREQILQAMTEMQNLLVMIGIAATTVPFYGALVNLLLRRIVLMLEERKNEFRNTLDAANRIQHRRNLHLAELYPERGPVGGAEDDPR